MRRLCVNHTQRSRMFHVKHCLFFKHKNGKIMNQKKRITDLKLVFAKNPVVKKMDLLKISPHKNNPRECDLAIGEVKQLIIDYGFLEPIVVDKNNIIIVGYMRYFAALELGLEIVPVIVAEHLSKKQADAYRLADNKTSQYGAWDMGIPETEILPLNDFYTGFSENEIDELFDPDFDYEDGSEQDDLDKVKAQRIKCLKVRKKFDATKNTVKR